MDEQFQNKNQQEAIDCGVVVQKNPDDTAQVMLPRREGCRGDLWSKNICHQIDQDSMILKTDNPLKAREGDRVEVRFMVPEKGKSMFMVYILPILILIVGAGIGNVWDPFGNQNLSAVVGAFVLLILSLLLIFRLNRRKWGPEGSHLPKITSILDE